MKNTKDTSSDVNELEQKLVQSHVPADLRQVILVRASRVMAHGQFTDSERFGEYIDWIISLPWEQKTEDVLDLTRAKSILDSRHYGLAEIKDRILEYIAVMKLQNQKLSSAPGVLTADKRVFRTPVLCFVGLVGTGKTTIAAAIAESLGRTFVRIAFGGLGDPAMLRGEPRYRNGGEPGQIIKALRRAEVRNPVILLDELDRIVETMRASIMGVLVEILDPEQNHAFVDSYLDYPFDLSQVLFITTANNTTNIATAVLDRLEIIQMPSYSNEEKVVIGRDFLLPRIIEQSGLAKDSVTVDEAIWPMIVRPLGYDAGMRTLERTIEGIVRKLARQVVEGKQSTFQLNETNIKDYLPTW